MALNQIKPGLRALVHNSIQPAKVQIIIPAGDTLHVSADVAAQLQAANTHFIETLVDETPVDDPETTETETDEVKPKSRKPKGA